MKITEKANKIYEICKILCRQKSHARRLKKDKKSNSLIKELTKINKLMLLETNRLTWCLAEKSSGHRVINVTVSEISELNYNASQCAVMS
jgi:hypothetical protein